MTPIPSLARSLRGGFRALVGFALGLAPAFAACGEDAEPTPEQSAGKGGSSARAGAGGAGSGTAGQSSGHAASAGAGAHGEGGAGNAAGAAGEGGDTSPGGEAGHENGGSGGLLIEPVAFCSRLLDAVGLAGFVALDFDFASAEDCRVAGIPFLYVLESSNERATFLNQLASFNYALWGCSGAAPPDEFALIYTAGLSEDPRPITSADIDALIEDYLAVAKPRLALSQRESLGLSGQLHDLAGTVMSIDSTEYSRSNCGETGGAGGDDAGGAAGAAGAGGQGGA